MRGQVVVAADEHSLADVEEMFGAVGEWQLLRSDRWVARYEVRDEALATKLTAKLRNAGHPAVVGPPDEARAVAWEKRDKREFWCREARPRRSPCWTRSVS